MASKRPDQGQQMGFLKDAGDGQHVSFQRSEAKDEAMTTAPPKPSPPKAPKPPKPPAPASNEATTRVGAPARVATTSETAAKEPAPESQPKPEPVLSSEQAAQMTAEMRERNRQEAEAIRKRLIDGAQRLTRRAQTLLAMPNAGLGSQEESDFLEWYEKWIALETEARIKGLEGCIQDSGRCAEDLVVRCQSCGAQVREPVAA